MKSVYSRYSSDRSDIFVQLDKLKDTIVNFYSIA
jgi:hypothetical protein